MLQLIISPSSSDFFNVCRWFTIIAVHFPGLNFAVYYNFPTLEVNSPLKLPTLFQLILGEKKYVHGLQSQSIFLRGQFANCENWFMAFSHWHLTFHSSLFAFHVAADDSRQKPKSEVQEKQGARKAKTNGRHKSIIISIIVMAERQPSVWANWLQAIWAEKVQSMSGII